MAVSGQEATDLLGRWSVSSGAPSPPARDRRDIFDLARDDRLEAIAEDRAYEAEFGGTDEDGDLAALRWENALERQWESAQDWSERGGRL